MDNLKMLDNLFFGNRVFVYGKSLQVKAYGEIVQDITIVIKQIDGRQIMADMLDRQNGQLVVHDENQHYHTVKSDTIAKIMIRENTWNREITLASASQRMTDLKTQNVVDRKNNYSVICKIFA